MIIISAFLGRLPAREIKANVLMMLGESTRIGRPHRNPKLVTFPLASLSTNPKAGGGGGGIASKTITSTHKRARTRR